MRNNLSTKLIGLSSLALTALLVTGAGCASTTTNTNLSNVDTTTVPVDNTNVSDVVATTDDASITIVSPEDGEEVEPQFDVTVEIAGLTLAPDEVEAANVEGRGHYHVWVDGEYYAAGVSDNTTVTDLTAGEHEIMVSLQNNDHTDLATPVKSNPITVNVVE